MLSAELRTDAERMIAQAERIEETWQLERTDVAAAWAALKDPTGKDSRYDPLG